LRSRAETAPRLPSFPFSLFFFLVPPLFKNDVEPLALLTFGPYLKGPPGQDVVFSASNNHSLHRALAQIAHQQRLEEAAPSSQPENSDHPHVYFPHRCRALCFFFFFFGVLYSPLYPSLPFPGFFALRSSPEVHQTQNNPAHPSFRTVFPPKNPLYQDGPFDKGRAALLFCAPGPNQRGTFFIAPPSKTPPQAAPQSHCTQTRRSELHLRPPPPCRPRPQRPYRFVIFLALLSSCGAMQNRCSSLLGAGHTFAASTTALYFIPIGQRLVSPPRTSTSQFWRGFHPYGPATPVYTALRPPLEWLRSIWREKYVYITPRRRSPRPS